jgi:alkylated DNA repair dioxygenase AlkB
MPDSRHIVVRHPRICGIRSTFSSAFEREFDSVDDVPDQLSLLAGGPAAVRADVAVVREPLDETSWFDLGRGWLAGADRVYEEMADGLAWQHRSRPMYGEMVAEPRLTAPVSVDRFPIVASIAEALSDRYSQPLRQSWANWYRDGDDAVAWHGDRIGRTQVNPLVAIVSLGGPRNFGIRPADGGASRRIPLHSGDLLVMGGAMQHRWQHSVPRQRHAGGRMSLTFRVDVG